MKLKGYFIVRRDPKDFSKRVDPRGEHTYPIWFVTVEMNPDLPPEICSLLLSSSPDERAEAGDYLRDYRGYRPGSYFISRIGNGWKGYFQHKKIADFEVKEAKRWDENVEEGQETAYFYEE